MALVEFDIVIRWKIKTLFVAMLIYQSVPEKYNTWVKIF